MLEPLSDSPAERALLAGLDRFEGRLAVLNVSLPEGFSYDVVASYRDRIGGGETFGYNNDFIAYLPLVEGRGHQEGLLWVNHEYPDPFFIHGNANPETKTAGQIELEQYAVGGSMIRVVRRGDGPWAGLAFRFGSVPNQSESTGPIWSPRQDTMYWPRGNKTAGTNPSEPLPSVIAVRRS